MQVYIFLPTKQPKNSVKELKFLLQQISTQANSKKFNLTYTFYFPEEGELWPSCKKLISQYAINQVSNSSQPVINLNLYPNSNLFWPAAVAAEINPEDEVFCITEKAKGEEDSQLRAITDIGIAENLTQHELQLQLLLQKPALKQVVTQPDRQNRKKVIKNPISIWAEESCINTFKPYSINKEYQDWLSSFKHGLDLAIVASFGQILSQKVLDTAKYGMLNWHPSLLPKYRGPSPMQTAILNKDTETGLSWIKMTKAMDAGGIYLQTKVSLDENTSFLSLSDEMGLMGANTWALALVGML